MAELPLAEGIDRFKQNEDRMDRFTNGSDTQTFVTSGGQSVPTIRKFLKDKDTEINVATDGILVASQTAATESASARDVAVVAQVAAETAAATATAQLNKSIRFDVAQTLTAPQQAQAIANAGAASAAQGVKADTTFKNEVNLLSYSPSLMVGTDVSAAMQALFNDAAAKQTVARIPPHPVAGAYWRLTTGVTIPAFVTVEAAGAKVEAYGAISAFTSSGPKVIIRDLTLIHYGTLKAVNFLHLGCKLVGGEVTGSDSSATDDLIYFNNAFSHVTDVNITNNRAATSFAINCDRIGTVSDGINIESHIEKNTIGGSGRGIRIGASGGAPRPEGVEVTSNKMFVTGGQNLVIEQVLGGKIADNTFDQGGPSGSVILAPRGSGISSVNFVDNWIAAPNGGRGPAIGYLYTAGVGIVSDCYFGGNNICYSSNGICLGENATDCVIGANTYSDLTGAAILIDKAKRITFGEGSYRNVAFNMSVTDGTTGGPFLIKGGLFLAGAGFVLNKTTASNFVFEESQGVRLAGRASATVAISSGGAPPTIGTVYVLIPHGLQATPDTSKITAGIVVVSGAYPMLSCFVVSTDATNVTVAVCYQLATAGTVRINISASI